MNHQELEELIRNLFSLIQERYHDNTENLSNVREKDFATRLEEEILADIGEFFKSQSQEFDLQLEENIEDFERPNEPDFTVILDSMDGSHHLIEGEGSFGTVIGIADCENPKFGDIKASGFLNLDSGRKYIALKNRGAYEVSENSRTRLETSDTEKLEDGIGTKILLQQGFLAKYPEIATKAWNHWCNDYGSQAQHYAMIADGRRNIFITGGHGNIDAKPVNSAEELGGMYLLVKEAGGSVTNWHGEDIADETIGMRQEINHDVIATSSEKLAQETFKDIIPKSYLSEDSKEE